MTRQEFRELTFQIARYTGSAYIEDVTEVNSLINERIRAFAIKTRCLYDDAVPFATAVGTAIYDLRTDFDRELVEIDQLFIEGSPLYNFQGLPGPCSIKEVAAFNPSYLTASNGKPSKFCQLPSSKVRVFPPADEVYTGCYASGWYIPAAITVAASGDSQGIDIPEEYQRAAAYFTAISLIVPHSTGEADFQKIALLEAQMERDLAELRSRNQRLWHGPSIRGTTRNAFRLSL